MEKDDFSAVILTYKYHIIRETQLYHAHCSIALFEGIKWVFSVSDNAKRAFDAKEN